MAKLKITTMSNIPTHEDDWLWQNIVPKKKLSLWYGDGGEGKSLTTLEVAARLSRGERLPGETKDRAPCSSLFVTTEDDSNTIKARLEVASADCSKIRVITGTTTDDGGEGSFDAVKNVDLLAEQIDALPDCGLLVIDPLAEFMPSVNFWKDDALRPALVPLRKLARDKDVAIVLVAHLNKSEGSVKQRLNGAMTLINVCRAAWLFVSHPDDEETGLMLVAKGNDLKRGQTGFQFCIEDVPHFGANKPGVPRLCWYEEPATITANEVLNRQRARSSDRDRDSKAPKFDEAVNWLKMMLAGSPKHPQEIKVLREAQGISAPTLDRAKRHLEVVKNHLGQWELPSPKTAA